MVLLIYELKVAIGPRYYSRAIHCKNESVILHTNLSQYTHQTVCVLVLYSLHGRRSCYGHGRTTIQSFFVLFYCVCVCVQFK